MELGNDDEGSALCWQHHGGRNSRFAATERIYNHLGNRTPEGDNKILQAVFVNERSGKMRWNYEKRPDGKVAVTLDSNVWNVWNLTSPSTGIYW